MWTFSSEWSAAASENQTDSFLHLLVFSPENIKILLDDMTTRWTRSLPQDATHTMMLLIQILNWILKTVRFSLHCIQSCVNSRFISCFLPGHRCSVGTGDLFQTHTHSDDRIMPRHDFRMKCVWTETCRAAERSHSSEQQTHTWTGSKQNRLCCSAASEQRNQSDSQRFSACIKGRRHTLIGCSHSLTHLSDRWSESAPISAERFWHVSDQTMK